MYFLLFYIWLASCFDLQINQDVDHYPLLDLGQYTYIDPTSKCTREALIHIVKECREKGIDSLDLNSRKYSAIKLTVCEMENLNLQPLALCRHMGEDTDTIDLCLKQMELYTPVWTLFCGNYREIHKLCYEESLPFEKENILKLYSNITQMFYKMAQENDAAMEISERKRKSLEVKLEELGDQINEISREITLSYGTTFDNFQSSFGALQDLLESNQELFQLLMENGKTEVNELTVNLNFLSLQIKDIHLLLLQNNVETYLRDLENDIKLKSETIISDVNKVGDYMIHKVQYLEDYLYESNKLSSQLYSRLKSNEMLAKEVENILDNTQKRAVEYESSLLNERDRMESFLNELVGGLSIPFAEIEYRVGKYLESLDAQIEVTQAKLENINRDIEILSQWSSLAPKLVSSLKNYTDSFGTNVRKLYETLIVGLTKNFQIWNLVVLPLIASVLLVSSIILVTKSSIFTATKILMVLSICLLVFALTSQFAAKFNRNSVGIIS